MPHSSFELETIASLLGNFYVNQPEQLALAREWLACCRSNEADYQLWRDSMEPNGVFFSRWAAGADAALEILPGFYSPQIDSACLRRVLEQIVRFAADHGARLIITQLPHTTAERWLRTLHDRGFIPVGEIRDYYSPGVHQQILLLRLP